ncbi:MAG: UbiX family flavin prenyltransferase [Acidaminococcales bacterium]|jgi:4-hydroxy-3-polyprenylbenzoate decarboxylase|nr:UbiX family flavin prenyltransferase [Acidaminococcales bacterium]
MKEIIVAMTGASGQLYAVRLLEFLQEFAGARVHLILSEWAQKTLELETDYDLKYVLSLADYVYRIDDQAAAISSGSFPRSGMVVVPCSIKTLSAIANSYTVNLIARAADVTLKERKRLILVVRETPLHQGHIHLLERAGAAGAIIAPPVPAFYNRPQTIMEMIDHSVYRWLDLLDIKLPGAKRWTGLNKLL